MLGMSAASASRRAVAAKAGLKSVAQTSASGLVAATTLQVKPWPAPSSQ